MSIFKVSPNKKVDYAHHVTAFGETGQLACHLKDRGRVAPATEDAVGDSRVPRDHVQAVGAGGGGGRGAGGDTTTSCQCLLCHSALENTTRTLIEVMIRVHSLCVRTCIHSCVRACVRARVLTCVRTDICRHS